jgi:glycine cleavage system regulatory protein
MDSFVLSIIGGDRTGLVEALSDVVVAHGGSWERSQMTELAGVFAGVALVHVPSDRVDAFRNALGPLHDQGLLDVTLHPADVDAERSSDDPTVRVEVVGADRPGIVRELSALLASMGVAIVDLATRTEQAAMAGELLFRVDAEVRLPAGVGSWDLTAALENLADDLMVDLSEGEPGRT